MSSAVLLPAQRQQLVSRYRQADNAVGLFQACNTLLPLAVLWVAVVAAAPVSGWLVAVLVLPISLFTLRVLVLMHECGHGSLFRSARLNRAFGFTFGVLAGMPQYVWSQHHNFHHAHNGDWEVYRGPLTSPSVDEYAAMSERQRRTYRWTRHVALAPLGGFVYLLFNPRFNWMKGSLQLAVHRLRGRPTAQFRTRCWKTAREYRHMSWNNIVLLCAWVLMSALVDATLFFPVYVASVSLAGGAGIALFTVQHNFDGAYAADTAHWDHDAGALKGTSFLQLPGWLNWFTASIAYHHVHHLSASIPNYRLAACHRENAHLFTDVPRIGLRGIPGALKCLLWDRQAQRIIPLAAFREPSRPVAR